MNQMMSGSMMGSMMGSGMMGGWMVAALALGGLVQLALLVVLVLAAIRLFQVVTRRPSVA